MNITPRIKSARNRNNLVVNVSIEIPLKQKFPISHRSQETSISPSPNKHKKKYKLIATNNYDRKTLNSSNLNTVRDMPYNVEHPPSRKKYSNPTPSTMVNVSTKANLAKFKSCDLSPKKKGQGTRKAKDAPKITRNISILERAINEDDNIIKYTTNSNELREKYDDFILIENLGRKIDTHISEIDITEIRKIENSAKDNKEKHYLSRINDFLRTASAKKIQRAWRNYKTKKLIRSYSNDIRNKYLRSINISEDPLSSVRSQGMGLKFKKKLPDYEEISAREVVEEVEEVEEKSAPAEEGKEKPDKNSKIVKKIQEDNMEKWEGFLEQIKNKKNLSAALEFSLERSKQLKQELGKDFFEKQPSEAGSSDEKKIIKTKKYYEGEREKWRESIQRSNGSINREERVNYFQNEMLRLQNDYSDSGDSSMVHSFEVETAKEQEEIENLKLRKKLEIFRNHLPEISPYQPEVEKEKESLVKPQTHSNRIDIATIIRKKSEFNEKPSLPVPALQPEKVEPQPQEINIKSLAKAHSIQFLLFDVRQDSIERSFSNESSEELIDTHRAWRPILQLEQKQNISWKEKLKDVLSKREAEMSQIIFEELILEALIEVSQSQKLIAFIKGIFDKTKNKTAKAEGILTNHSSIKDYINFFINYLYQYHIEDQLYRNLLKPIGPGPRDVLKYFRGEEIAYDPESEYVMSIKIFNLHWDYASDLIYFDKKWTDQKKEVERVNYLKQLTKVFFRAIFDCFNESLESQRIYGIQGKPYPWSRQKLNVEVPTLKKSLSAAFQRVLKYSLIFAGVHFSDKHHSLDEQTIEEIQESNMVKLLTLEMKDDDPLWLFLEDELAEIKLELAHYIETQLLKEITMILGLGLGVGVSRGRGQF